MDKEEPGVCAAHFSSFVTGSHYELSARTELSSKPFHKVDACSQAGHYTPARDQKKIKRILASLINITGGTVRQCFPLPSSMMISGANHKPG